MVINVMDLYLSRSEIVEEDIIFYIFFGGKKQISLLM